MASRPFRRFPRIAAALLVLCVVALVFSIREGQEAEGGDCPPWWPLLWGHGTTPSTTREVYHMPFPLKGGALRAGRSHGSGDISGRGMAVPSSCAVVIEALGAASLQEALWGARSLRLVDQDTWLAIVLVADAVTLAAIPSTMAEIGLPGGTSPFSRAVDIDELDPAAAAEGTHHHKVSAYVEAGAAASATAFGCKRDECSVGVVRALRIARLRYMGRLLDEYSPALFLDSDTILCRSLLPLFRHAAASDLDVLMRPVPVATRGAWGETTADGTDDKGRPLVEPPVPEWFPSPHGGFLLLRNTTGARAMVSKTLAMYERYRGKAHPTSDQAAYRAAIFLLERAGALRWGELGQEFGCNYQVASAPQCLVDYTYEAKAADKSSGKHGKEWQDWFALLERSPQPCVLVHNHFTEMRLKAEVTTSQQRGP